MGCSDIARWLNQRTIETQGKLENTLVHGMRMVLMLMRKRYRRKMSCPGVIGDRWLSETKMTARL